MTSSPPARDFDLDLALVTEVDLPKGVTESDLTRVACHVLVAENASGAWEVTVALVSDDRLQALHRDFMGIDAPTDIMTFPQTDESGTIRGGDLVISVDQALAQANAAGTAVADEVRFLVVHGLLHLRGWRDEGDEQRQAMLARQRHLLRQFAEAGDAMVR